MRPADLDKKAAKPQGTPGKPQVYVMAPLQWVIMSSGDPGCVPWGGDTSSLSVTVATLYGNAKRLQFFSQPHSPRSCLWERLRDGAISPINTLGIPGLHMTS